MSKSEGVRVLADNRRARHNYHHAGVLPGRNGSARQRGQVSSKRQDPAFRRLRRGERQRVMLLNARTLALTATPTAEPRTAASAQAVGPSPRDQPADREDSRKRTYLDPHTRLFAKGRIKCDLALAQAKSSMTSAKSSSSARRMPKRERQYGKGARTVYSTARACLQESFPNSKRFMHRS